LAGSVSKQNPKESSKISTAKSGISNRKAAVISLFAMKGFNRAPEIALNIIILRQTTEILKLLYAKSSFFYDFLEELLFVIRVVNAK
jgi:hypothetical protein